MQIKYLNATRLLLCGDLTSLTNDDFHTGGTDGHAGDCSTSLQEGDYTRTPYTGLRIK